MLKNKIQIHDFTKAKKKLTTNIKVKRKQNLMCINIIKINKNVYI